MTGDREIFKKLFSFILMGLSGLWANYLVRETIVRFANSRFWRNMVGNLSLFCWICAAAGLFYAWKKGDCSVFFRTGAWMFTIVSMLIPFLAGMADTGYFLFSALLAVMTLKSGSIGRHSTTGRSSVSSGPVILTASSGKDWSPSGLVLAREVRKACSDSLDKGFVLMDRNILSTWKRGKALFKEIRGISKRVNTRFDLKNYENTCLYIENVRQELASHLVRIQHLYNFRRRNTRGPEKINILKMEKKIKTAVVTIIKGLESMKARALIMEIGSISGLQDEADKACESLELADHALTGLSMAHFELEECI